MYWDDDEVEPQRKLDDFVQDRLSDGAQTREPVHGDRRGYPDEQYSIELKGGDEKMDKELLEKAESYLEVLDKIKERVSEERTAMSILTEVNKDRRMTEMREERNAENGGTATAKQLAYLKRLGVKTKAGLTKQEASVLIDEAVDKIPEKEVDVGD